ncbi:MAG: hypothetical protein KJ077_10975 [Anaerolineae bacterium]|nr:hypothetical protein [Anaerolineae bacterium]
MKANEQLPLFPTMAIDPDFPPPIGATVTLLPAAIECVRRIETVLSLWVRDVYIPGLDFPIPVFRPMEAGETGQVVTHEWRPDPFRGQRLVAVIAWVKGGRLALDAEEFYRCRRWYRFS